MRVFFRVCLCIAKQDVRLNSNQHKYVVSPLMSNNHGTAEITNHVVTFFTHSGAMNNYYIFQMFRRVPVYTERNRGGRRRKKKVNTITGTADGPAVLGTLR